jgi:2'-5' RNA ligase
MWLDVAKVGRKIPLYLDRSTMTRASLTRDMPDTTRTFPAVAVPDELTKRLNRPQDRLAPGLRNVCWTNVPPFHVMLVFLVHISDTDLNSVRGASAEASKGFAPFAPKLEGPGAFPNSARPRVLWAGQSGLGSKR